MYYFLSQTHLCSDAILSWEIGFCEFCPFLQGVKCPDLLAACPGWRKEVLAPTVAKSMQTSRRLSTMCDWCTRKWLTAHVAICVRNRTGHEKVSNWNSTWKTPTMCITDRDWYLLPVRWNALYFSPRERPSRSIGYFKFFFYCRRGKMILNYVAV